MMMRNLLQPILISLTIIFKLFYFVTAQNQGRFSGRFHLVKTNQIRTNRTQHIYGTYSNGAIVDITSFANEEPGIGLIVETFGGGGNFESVDFTFDGVTTKDEQRFFSLRGNDAGNYTAVPELKINGPKSIILNGYNSSLQVYQTLNLEFTIINNNVPEVKAAFPNATVRINVGSTTDWNDTTTGNVWSADRFFIGGQTSDVCTRAIENTELDNLFCTDRYFMDDLGEYIIPVYPGEYNVTVMFAEVWFVEAGKRVFDISIQDIPVVANLDLFQVATKDTAYSLTFPATVSPPSRGTLGNIIISFKNVVEFAKLNAIEIKCLSVNPVSPIPAPTTETSTIRINAGSLSDWTDTRTGNVWQADNYFTGGATFTTPNTSDIANTIQDKLYLSERYFEGGGGEYNIPILPGAYNVTLMFAEVWHTSSTQRVFKVSVQDFVVASSLDVYQVANGIRRAYTINVNAVASNPSSGTMSNIKISFQNSVDNAKINAIVVSSFGSLPPSPPITPIAVPSVPPAPVSVAPTLTSTIRINAGSLSDWTDSSTGNVWQADNYFTGGDTFITATTDDIVDTTLDTLFLSERFFKGGGGEYNIPVLPGAYNVTLMFVEVWFGEIFKRVFKVSVQDVVVASSLDIVKEANGKMRAYTINVNAVAPTPSSGTMSNIKISFQNSVENSKINAIVISSAGPLPPSPPITPIAVPIPPAPVPVPIAPVVPVASPVLVIPPSYKPTNNAASKHIVRIDVGSTVNYTDPLGNVWMSDRYISDGDTRADCPLDGSGDIPRVYCDYRYFGNQWGAKFYQIPVKPGAYTVRLMMAEYYFQDANKRVFNVSVQGFRYATNLDLVKDAGYRKAHVVEANVSAPNIDGESGYIQIGFHPIIENPLINAIEIESIALEQIVVPTAAPVVTVSTFQTIRINCGYNSEYVDTLGSIWLPDQHFSGGQSSSLTVPDIFGTEDDQIVIYERAGNAFTYSIPVPAAVYQVTLLFAETHYNAITERVGDIKVEALISDAYDILTIVPKSTFTNLVFYPVVEDGFLSIEITKSAASSISGPPKINGIIIQLDRPHMAHAVATGPYFGTISNPLTGTAKVALKGETSHTHGPGLTLVNSTWKEGSNILGTTINLEYDFTAGNHTISLNIGDSGGNEGTDVATVSIRPFGYPTITQLSPEGGNLTGNYPVTITGSGFNYSANDTIVIFGQVELTGSSILIIDSTTIQVVCQTGGVNNKKYEKFIIIQLYKFITCVIIYFIYCILHCQFFVLVILH